MYSVELGTCRVLAGSACDQYNGVHGDRHETQQYRGTDGGGEARTLPRRCRRRAQAARPHVGPASRLGQSPLTIRIKLTTHHRPLSLNMLSQRGHFFAQ